MVERRRIVPREIGPRSRDAEIVLLGVDNATVRFAALREGCYRSPFRTSDSKLYLPPGSAGLVVENESVILLKHLKSKPGRPYGVVLGFLNGEVRKIPDKEDDSRYFMDSPEGRFFFSQRESSVMVGEIEIQCKFL